MRGEGIGVRLARRLVARLSLAARAQELEAELRSARAELAAGAGAVLTARHAVEAQKALSARLAQVEAEHREALRGRDDDIAELNDGILRAEREREALRVQRDQALQDADDLRACHHEAEAENTRLRAEAEERQARQAEVLRVREEELAAVLGLPERRSWPDLLDAARRLLVPSGDAALIAQRDAANRRADRLGRELQQAKDELAEERLLVAGLPSTRGGHHAP